MKIAGIILSMLIFTLNGVPCCWEHGGDEEPVEQHTDAEQNCSPFLSCGNCAGFVLQEDLPEIRLYTYLSGSETEFPEQRIFSEFSESIWQPPKPDNEL